MLRLFAIALTLLCLLLDKPSVAASPFDGVYSGTATWAGNGNRRCNNVPEFKIAVRDGQFNYGSGDDRVPVMVGNDGSFSAQSGQRHIQGKISGGQLQATTSGASCNYMWDLKK